MGVSVSDESRVSGVDIVELLEKVQELGKVVIGAIETSSIASDLELGTITPEEAYDKFRSVGYSLSEIEVYAKTKLGK